MENVWKAYKIVQDPNFGTKKSNASINKSSAPPKVLYPNDLKYEIRGKDEKKGVKDNANPEVSLSDFKGKPVVMSKILKLECDGTDQGNVINVKPY